MRPVWQSYGKTWSDFAKEVPSRIGIEIEIQTSEQNAQHLIGTINALAGVCDDCTAFSPHAIVIRYRRVWS